MNARTIWQAVYCGPVALAYQAATNPFLQAGALLLPYLAALVPWWPLVPVWPGNWQAAVWIVGVWLALCGLAVAFRVRRPSRITAAEIITAPAWLHVLGNEQEGFLPPWYVARRAGWPDWLIALEWCAWRNKARNLPFIPLLRWLHRPAGALVEHRGRLLGVDLLLVTRGWLVEFRWFHGEHFGDIGPRLDHPDAWGGVSWAFRPWGKE